MRAHRAEVPCQQELKRRASEEADIARQDGDNLRISDPRIALDGPMLSFMPKFDSSAHKIWNIQLSRIGKMIVNKPTED